MSTKLNIISKSPFNFQSQYLDIWSSRVGRISAQETINSVLGLFIETLALSRSIIRTTTNLIRSLLSSRLLVVGDNGSGNTIVGARDSLGGLLSVWLEKCQQIPTWDEIHIPFDLEESPSPSIDRKRLFFQYQTCFKSNVFVFDFGLSRSSGFGRMRWNWRWERGSYIDSSGVLSHDLFRFTTSFAHTARVLLRPFPAKLAQCGLWWPVAPWAFVEEAAVADDDLSWNDWMLWRSQVWLGNTDVKTMIEWYVQRNNMLETAWGKFYRSVPQFLGMEWQKMAKLICRYTPIERFKPRSRS